MTPFYTTGHEPPAQRALKIAIFAAPWVVGTILLWRTPMYLAIFLGLSVLFAIVQRRHAPPLPPTTKYEDDEESDDDEQAQAGTRHR